MSMMDNEQGKLFYSLNLKAIEERKEKINRNPNVHCTLVQSEEKKPGAPPHFLNQ
jgi:hypothetical protein